MGYYFGSGSNPAQTRVAIKKSGSASARPQPGRSHRLEFPAEFVEFLRQNFIKKIYRRVIDADECDSGIKLNWKHL